MLPLRFFIDQDALDFLANFFSHQPAYRPVLISATSLEAESSPGTANIPTSFFQWVYVHPLELRVDYKPKRVDFRSLSQGQYQELLNFFQLESADIRLHGLQLCGLQGWTRVWESVLSEWIPHITNAQLPNLISGLRPIKTLMNVGNSVANLVILPIEQYQKDGRIVYGIKRGAGQFIRKAGAEGAKLGANLAVGAQILLKTADLAFGSSEKEADGVNKQQRFSHFSDPPISVYEGLQTAYQALSEGVSDAMETIIAIPVETEENGSKDSSTLKRVVKAVPIAVLRPMLGASEAIKTTMLGLHATLQPGARLTMADKYKSRKNQKR